MAYRLSSRCWWHKQRQTPIHTKSISEHCCWSWCKISAQNFASVELCWIFNSMSRSKTTIIIYPGIKDEVITALIRSSLESNRSTNRPLGLQRICVTATAAKIECQLLRNCTLKREIHNNCDTEQDIMPEQQGNSNMIVDPYIMTLSQECIPFLYMSCILAWICNWKEEACELYQLFLPFLIKHTINLDKSYNSMWAEKKNYTCLGPAHSTWYGHHLEENFQEHLWEQPGNKNIEHGENICLLINRYKYI